MWIFDFISKDKVKVLTAMAKTIGKLFLGKLADNAWTACLNATWKAEQIGGSGEDKFDYAMKDLVETLKSPTTGKWVLSVLIEIAVGVMKASKGQL